MNEDRPGEGGAANTPPFPRLVGVDISTPPTEASNSLAADPNDSVESSPLSSTDVREEDEYAPPADQGGPWGETEPRVPRDRSRFPFPDRAGEHFRRHAESTLTRAFQRSADHLDDAADRITRVGKVRFGDSEAPGVAAHLTAGWMAGAAGYLRSSDLPSMQTDLERQLRERPLRTLLIALGTGWLLGRILR